MICFHGTTSKGIESILKGIDTKGDNVTAWSVSDNDGAFYLYPMNKIEGDTLEERTYTGIDSAFGSAQVQAAMNGSNDLYVIEFKVNGGLLEDDYSCDNMADIASFISMGDLDKIEIKAIYHCEFNQYLAAFVVAQLLENINFNSYSIDSSLMDAAQAVAECDFYIDSLYDFDYSEISESEVLS